MSLRVYCTIISLGMMFMLSFIYSNSFNGVPKKKLLMSVVQNLAPTSEMTEFK